jgi:hypothetical protein
MPEGGDLAISTRLADPATARVLESHGRDEWLEAAFDDTGTGIPEEHLSGHAWHTYTLISADGTTRFEFTHNVNGREIYGLGTLDALAYLDRKIAAGASGRVFTMIDVLKGA